MMREAVVEFYGVFQVLNDTSFTLSHFAVK